MKAKGLILGIISLLILIVLIFLLSPNSSTNQPCTQLSSFDSFISDPFNSEVGKMNQNSQKEASVVGELIAIGEAEFQPRKYGPSNYKRELTFKGNNEENTFTYFFPSNSILRGWGANDTLLDPLETGKTYQLNLLANPPSPTVSIYLTSYKAYSCN